MNFQRDISRAKVTRVVVIDAEVPQDGWVGVDLPDGLRTASSAPPGAADEIVIEAAPVGSSWGWPQIAARPQPSALAEDAIREASPPPIDLLRDQVLGSRRRTERGGERWIALVAWVAETHPPALDARRPCRSGSCLRFGFLLAAGRRSSGCRRGAFRHHLNRSARSLNDGLDIKIIENSIR